jgi:uncharacterized coiled-coil DUF342 family protein
MKFGHVFKETLKNEGFPADWVDSAISYSQLKKCINRLTNELAQLGLDPQTLKKLLKQVEDYNAGNRDDDRPLEYLLSAEEVAEANARNERYKSFHPKLVFYVNEATGELDSAHLNEETKHKLQMLAMESGLTDLRVVELPSLDDPLSSPTTISSTGSGRRPGYRTVEVPITSDSEFFSKLAAELSGLELLQQREEKRMHGEIQQLGQQIARLTDPDRRANKKLISVWREIFQIYLESDIFFGTTETDHQSRDFEKAAERFELFSSKIAQQGLVDKFKKPENLKALNMFMQLNREILQGLRFGEINRTAMMKILKSMYFLGLDSEYPKIHAAMALSNRSTLTTSRIRQTNCPGRQIHLSPPNHLPRLLRASRQSRLRRSQHPDPQPRAPARRLQLSHVLRNQVAARSSPLPPRILHPLLDRYADE